MVQICFLFKQHEIYIFVQMQVLKVGYAIIHTIQNRKKEKNNYIKTKEKKVPGEIIIIIIIIG